jgi:hypothetical protein
MRKSILKSPVKIHGRGFSFAPISGNDIAAINRTETGGFKE